MLVAICLPSASYALSANTDFATFFTATDCAIAPQKQSSEIRIVDNILFIVLFINKFVTLRRVWHLAIPTLPSVNCLVRDYGKNAIASYALWMRGYGKDAIASYNAKSDLALSIAACDTSLPESICAISVMRCSSVSCVIVDTVPCSVSCFATL